MPKTHTLKTWPVYYRDVLSKAKKFEIRKNDRGFKVGDKLKLVEFVPANDMENGRYTGNHCIVEVTHIICGPVLGLKSGWAVLSIELQESTTADDPDPKIDLTAVSDGQRLVFDNESGDIMEVWRDQFPNHQWTNGYKIEMNGAMIGFFDNFGPFRNRVFSMIKKYSFTLSQENED